MAWRDRLAVKSGRQADYAFAVSVSKVRRSAGKRLVIRVGAPRRARLDAIRSGCAAGETTLLTERGTPWTEGGFRASWRKACALAGVEGVTFHDLRGTAVTQLALAGATPPRSPPLPVTP